MAGRLARSGLSGTLPDVRAGHLLVVVWLVLGSATLERVAHVLDAFNDCGELGGDCPPGHDCHDCAHCTPSVAIASPSFRLVAPRPRDLDVFARPHADRRPPGVPPREILVVPRA
jgi:hypothetical protein